MKKLVCIVIVAFVSHFTIAQTSDTSGVIKACTNYIEGFYEGDTSKLKASLQPTLHKFGFWKDEGKDSYRQVNHMSFDQALAFAQNVKDKKNFPAEDAPRDVTILDMGDTIAAARVTAWWGIDYILLSKRDDKWMIEQVLWEGPLKKEHQIKN
ncbi:nuclear transport factor 2 family protein [Psychroserpens sp. SPM9]|uniref:nuclear transport factor 2 family protein n=1 Tax=Psychroserpens sp. SPM9 TaxID=2975598 RepID=UPI0021A602CB|nr:nuclear transport factor 2 family protein [Psychroserpens sp. SPM9]MDG5491752.1 nuclear transport factor 2 family protein [Psychroserpens sp. SPM9]